MGVRRATVNYTSEQNALRREERSHFCKWDPLCLKQCLLRDKIRVFILLARLFFPRKRLAAGEYICFSCLTFSKSNEGIVKIVHLCWNYIFFGIYLKYSVVNAHGFRGITKR